MTIPGLLILAVVCLATMTPSLYSQETVDDQTIYSMILRAADYRNRTIIDSAVSLAGEAYHLSVTSPQAHDTIRIMALNAMGWAHSLMGNYDSSLIYSRQALDLKNKTGDEENVLLIATLSTIGTAYYKMKNYDSAIAVFEHILEINKRIFDADDPIIGKSILNLGTIYHYSEQYEKAEEYLVKSLQLIKDQLGTDNQHYVIALNNISNLYRDIGQFDESEACQVEALSLRTRLYGENSIEVAKSLFGLSNLYIQRGKYLEALPICNRAYDIFVDQVGVYHDYTYAVVINIGRINLDKGHYEKAERFFLKAMDIAKNVFGEKSPDMATAMEWLAIVHRHQGRFSETISMLNQALDIFIDRYGEQNTRAASVLSQLSVNNLILGNYEIAESLQVRALHTREEIMGTGSYQVAYDLSNLANIHKLKGNCQTALELQQRAIAILDSTYGDINPQTIENKKDLADIYNDAKEYDTAESLAREVLQSYLEIFGEHHPQTAFTYKLLADIKYNRHEYERAEQYFEKAHEILAQYLGDNHPSLGEIEISMGKTLTRLGLFTQAGDVFAKFIRHRQKFLDYAFPLSSEEQKLDIIRRFPVLNADIINLALQADDPRLASLAFEMVINGKASVINAIKNERSTAICNLDDELRNILELHSEVRSTIASLAYVNVIDSSEYITADSLQSLYLVHDSLEIELARRCRDLNRGNEKNEYTSDDIRNALPDNGLLVEYYKCSIADSTGSCGNNDDLKNERYVALVMTRHDQNTVIDLGPASRIDSLITEVRQVFEDSYFEMNSPIAEDMCNYINLTTNLIYQTILMPVFKNYPGYDNVIIAPDGLLHLIPFEIMADNQHNFLVENYTFTYITGCRDLMRHTDIAPPDYRAIIIANPDFNRSSEYAGLSPNENDTNTFNSAQRQYRHAGNCFSGGFVRLEYGTDEYRAISNVLKDDSRINIELYNDGEARETVLKNLATPPFLIHMITHGFYCSDFAKSTHPGNINPLLKSGLAMAGANTTLGNNRMGSNGDSFDDGILTAFEVTSLNLEGTDLVTLSACESGVGQTLDGEGVFGLRCAFQNAGARSLLMSLWKIPDKETSQLMEYFYSFWVNGDSKADALRHAELKMIKHLKDRYGYALPYLWGGFVLTGTPE